jgi:hypothetical protein
MPIEPIIGHPCLPAATQARRRQTGFAVPECGTEAAAEAPAEAGAGARLPLLTLQAAGMADAQDAAERAAAKQGEGLLGAMRGLQLAILGAGGGAAQALGKLAESVPDSADPALNAVLRGIAQRAAIERARRG